MIEIEEKTNGPYIRSASGEYFTDPFFLIATLFKINTNEVTEKLPIDRRQSAEMWISPDPARQFSSPYAYSPDPINGTDPDGNYDIISNEDGDVSIERSPIIKLEHVYAESHDGTRYPANDIQTINQFKWNNIVSDWVPSLDFYRQVYAGLVDRPRGVVGLDQRINYVLDNSHEKGKMDRKHYLNRHSLYLHNGIVYNYAEGGNLIWGASVNIMKIPLSIATGGAQAFSLKKYGHFDQPNEVRAFQNGYNFENKK